MAYWTGLDPAVFSDSYYSAGLDQFRLSPYREANSIFTAEDIINKMRNPGPAPTHPKEWAGMKISDKDKIPDEEALKIANYILQTFK